MTRARDLASLLSDDGLINAKLNVEAGNPIITLKDTTDNDDHHIYFTDNVDTLLADINFQHVLDDFNIGTTTGRELNLFTNNATALTIDTSQNVGIGTTDPSRKLDISAAGNDGIRIGSGNALIGARGGGDTQLIYWNGSSAYYGRGALGGNVNSHEFRTGGLTRLTIASSGNVGISTSSPQDLLHIANTGNSPAESTWLRVQNDAGLLFAGVAASGDASVQSGGNLVFNTGPSYTPALTLDSSQNATFAGDIAAPSGNIFVGKSDATLGTDGTNIAGTSTIISASSGNTYHVYNTNTSTYPFVVSFDGTVTSGAIIASSGADQILTLDQATTGWNYVGFSTNGTRKFYVGNGGTTNFVIGSDDTGVALDISNFGSVDFDSANITGAGTISSGAITSTGKLQGTWAEFTATDSTDPGTDDLNVSGYGIIGNRASNPVYVHNNGAGGVRISSNDGLGTANGVLITDTSATFAGTIQSNATGGGQVVLNDTNATTQTQLNSWVSFQASGTEKGYVGYGTTSNDNLYLSNYAGDVTIAAAGGTINLVNSVEVNPGRINFGTSNVTPPTPSDAVTGARLNLYPTGSGQDYTIGIDSNTMWFNSDDHYKWYSDGTLKFQWDNTASDLKVGGQKVWNAGNDGAGSGLDADLLDGLQGSYYDHRRYTDDDTYLGGYYVSGGSEKQNDTIFGAGKLKIAMLGASNIGGASWNDVLWMSTYTGGDVKRSTALVSSKYDNTSVWVNKVDYDSASWGTNYLFWNTGNDGSGSGLDADLLDGLQSTSFLRSDANTATIGYLRAEGFTGTGGSGLRLSHPAGASYATQASSVTGAIKITLPVTWTSTMMRMTIKVYEYATSESFEIVCGGYNYTGGGGYWVNTFAYILGDPAVDRNFDVFFGHDGSKCAIYIGATTSTWSYPQVCVTEFEAGFSNYAEDTWNDGWSVGFTTSIGTVTSSQTSKMIGSYTRSLGVGTPASGTIGEIRATNNITAYYSDERLKNLEGPIDNALEKVQQLTGYYFTENEKAKELGYDNSRRQVGVSAQEVEKILPEVVTSAPIDEEYKSVWYDKLVPLLIEAVKELKQEVEELKRK